MNNLLFIGVCIAVILHVVFGDVETKQPDQYFLTINVNQEPDIPTVASIIKQILCTVKSKDVKSDIGLIVDYHKNTLSEVVGEDTILTVLEVDDPIQLEKRLNVIKLLSRFMKIKTERLTDYKQFVETIIQVDETLLQPSDNTPENVDQLIWCEVEIGYTEKTLAELVGLWKQEVEFTIAARSQGTKVDTIKIMGEKKVEIFAELPPIAMDGYLFSSPLLVNNGENIRTTCRSVLNLDYYIQSTMYDY